MDRAGCQNGNHSTAKRMEKERQMLWDREGRMVFILSIVGSYWMVLRGRRNPVFLDRSSKGTNHLKFPGPF
jgi:hypothetical protein